MPKGQQNMMLFACQNQQKCQKVHIISFGNFYSTDLLYGQLIQKQQIVLEMLKIQQKPEYSSLLQEISHHMKINHYNVAYKACHTLQKQIMNRSKIQLDPSLLLNCYSRKEVEESLQLLQVCSLKSYCLINLNQLDEARNILEKCLKIYPNHGPSQRRLAFLLEKEGEIYQSLKVLNRMALYEPDNQNLAHALIKLTKLSKSLNCSNHKQNLESQQISKTTGEQEAISASKQHVTFGTSEIIEITSQQSDEYFAHIKQQINKLNEKKPKKSILKGSKVNKNSNSIPTHAHSEEEKVQLEEIIVKKTFSMKSSTESPSKWESDSFQDQKQVGGKKQKKKKKCVSFSVGKDIQEDKQS